MKNLLFLLVLTFAARAFAADGVATFRTGLQAYQANGPEALLNTWYAADDQARIADIRRNLIKAAAGLGEVVEVEVFAPRNLGKRVQRLYGVIYFARRPLWIRAEFYEAAGRSGFISLEFSPNADDILPLEIGVDNR